MEVPVPSSKGVALHQLCFTRFARVNAAVKNQQVHKLKTLSDSPRAREKNLLESHISVKTIHRGDL